MDTQSSTSRVPMTQFSTKYVSCLREGERRQLRGCAGPMDNYQPVAMLNGVKVERKGRGKPPASNKEADDSRRHGRRVVPGMSYFSCDDLLDLSRPATADALAAPRFARRVANQHNTSSMVGAGALLPQCDAVHIDRKVCRRPGTANPGRGLGNAMAESLVFNPDAQIRTQASKVWRAAGQPSLADTIIRHRYSDPDSPATPIKLYAERAATPVMRSHNLAESKSAYEQGRHEYVLNKAHAVYGFSHLHSKAHNIRGSDW